MMLAADAWASRLHEAALAGTPERTAALGAMLAPLMTHSDLAAIWATLLEGQLCASEHHVRLAAGNVIANLGAVAPLSTCAAIFAQPSAAGARIAALLALRPHAERVAPEDVLPALEDPDAVVQVLALELLGLMGERAPRDRLLALRTVPGMVGGAALSITAAQQDELAPDQRLWLLRYEYIRRPTTRSALRPEPQTREEALALRDEQDRLRAVQIAALSDNGVTYAELTALDSSGIVNPLVVGLLKRPGAMLPLALVPALGNLHPTYSNDGRVIAEWLRAHGDRSIFAMLFDLVRHAPDDADAPESSTYVPGADMLAEVGDVVPEDTALPLLDAERAIVRATALRVLGARLPVERLAAALHDSEELPCRAALQVAAQHPAWDDPQPILELARDGNGQTQALALQALARFGARLDLDTLADFLASDQQPLRDFAVTPLRQRTDPASLELLVTAFCQAADSDWHLGPALRERAGELTPEQVARIPARRLADWGLASRIAGNHPTDAAAQEELLSAFFGVYDDTAWLDDTVQALVPLVTDRPDLLARVAEMAASPLSARRRAAIDLLQHLKTEAATDLLARALAQEEHPGLGPAMAIRDRGIPLPAAALIPALRTREDEAREIFADLLGQTGDPAAVEPLLESLRLPGRYGHEGAERALLGLKDHISVERITQLAVSPSSWQRAMALSLAGVRPDAPQSLLLNGLNDPATRASALYALARRGEPFPAAAVAACARDPDVWVRVAAMRALAALGEACPPEPILMVLDDTDEISHAADAAREALEQVSAARQMAGHAALAYLRTRQPSAWMGIRSRCQATRALARLVVSDAAVWGDLGESLRWPHWQVRLVALHALREALTGARESTSAEQEPPPSEASAVPIVPAEIVRAVAALRDDPDSPAVRSAAERTLDAIIGSGLSDLAALGT